MGNDRLNGMSQQLNYARNMAAQVLFGVDQGTDAKKLLETQKQKAAAVGRCSADYVQWMSSFLTKMSLPSHFIARLQPI